MLLGPGECVQDLISFKNLQGFQFVSSPFSSLLQDTRVYTFIIFLPIAVIPPVTCYTQCMSLDEPKLRKDILNLQ